MIALSQSEKTTYKTYLEEIKRRPRDTYRRDDAIDPEGLKLLRKLWQLGKAFFITGVVEAPYAGCFSEPNIWLVTPSGCDEHDDLNASQWKPRYADPHGRTKALAEKNELVGEVWRMKWRIERELQPHIEKFGPDWSGIKVDNAGGTKTLEEMATEFEELTLLRDMLRFIEEVEPELQAHDVTLQAEIDARFPRLPDDPDAVVWPLYASGQGVAVDVIRNFSELCEWLVNGELPTDDGRQRRSRWERGFASSGSFDSFAVHPWEPISGFSPAEHYWASAVRMAEDKYSLALPWCCEKCGKEQEGVGESGAPHFTGYRGNGGIGVFMEGALCDDCFQAGICPVCEQHGGDDHEKYSPEVAEHGLTLCEWHAEELTKACLVGTEEAIDFVDSLPREQVLELKPRLANAGAAFLPGFEPEPIWEYRLVVPGRDGQPDKIVEGVTADGAELEGWARASHADVQDLCYHSHDVETENGVRFLKAGPCYGIAMQAGDVKI